MSGRNAMAMAAGLLTVLAFVPRASAQERAKPETNRGASGQPEQPKEAGANPERTQPAVGGESKRMDNGRDMNREQSEMNGNGNRYGERRDGYRSGEEGTFGSNNGRGWRGNRRYFSDGYYDNGYDNEYSGQVGQDYYSGSNGRDSRYFNPEMSNQVRNNCVFIRLEVPNPEAKVWFENEPTQQTGRDRIYLSPPLEPGKNYTYSIKASWMQNGHEVTWNKQLKVHANQMAMATATSDERGAQQETIKVAPIDAATKRPDTLGTPELQEPELKPEMNGLPDGEKTKKSPELVMGKIVSAKGGNLTIAESDGTNQRSFQIPNATKVTLNGQDVGNDELKAGRRVSISLKQGTKDTVSSVEVTPATQDKR